MRRRSWHSARCVGVGGDWVERWMSTAGSFCCFFLLAIGFTVAAVPVQDTRRQWTKSWEWVGGTWFVCGVWEISSRQQSDRVIAASSLWVVGVYIATTLHCPYRCPLRCDKTTYRTEGSEGRGRKRWIRDGKHTQKIKIICPLSKLFVNIYDFC